jgi:hypothetical protein
MRSAGLIQAGDPIRVPMLLSQHMDEKPGSPRLLVVALGGEWRRSQLFLAPNKMRSALTGALGGRKVTNLMMSANRRFKHAAAQSTNASEQQTD